MKIQSTIIACCPLLAGGSAFARDAFGDISMSTDPARAAAVEQQAHALAVHQAAMRHGRTARAPVHAHAHRHGQGQHGK